ncbi:MAG TPA: MotA/TolQ/ExbB proton channel family protein [Bryobacteraceae bacterium]|nr:MotA/TolQ/ExbB proton channel family protein [Bryobacteraceae bacterium]
MSTSAAVLTQTAARRRSSRRRIDLGLLGGFVIALATMVAGIAATGVKLSYFIQPSSLWIVFGGTLGVTFVTTPRRVFGQTLRRVGGLLWEKPSDPAQLLEEILSYLRKARIDGLLRIEPLIENASHPLLKDALVLALEMPRTELQAAIMTKISAHERHGEAEAKTLEVAGGFAPTIGVIGTVVGLVETLRQFSDVSSVASGVGAAFASTLYGLGLANLVLLPLAHRIRATVLENFEIETLILEGAICILDGVHPSLAPERLSAFVRTRPNA